MNESTLKLFINNIISYFVIKHRKNESILTAVATAYLTNEEVFKNVPLLDDVEFERTTILFSKIQELQLESFQLTEEAVLILLTILDCLVHYQIIFGIVFDSDQALIKFLTEFVLHSSNFKTLY